MDLFKSSNDQKGIDNKLSFLHTLEKYDFEEVSRNEKTPSLITHSIMQQEDNFLAKKVVLGRNK